MRRLSKDIQSFYPHTWPFDEIVAELPDKGNLIEIGPYLGKSTVTWAECFERHGKEWNIHTIDLFIGISKEGRPDNIPEDLEKHLDSLLISEELHEETFKNNIQGWDNITYEKGYFTRSYQPDKEYDVLWYDGLHDYDHVKEALTFWEDKVEHMIVDCYDELHPGTKRAVLEYVPKKILRPSEGKGIAWL
tara:strand:+ start:207 stop:776 length:570 start_codon:yes stop_codon:yes gene_type:complete